VRPPRAWRAPSLVSRPRLVPPDPPPAGRRRRRCRRRRRIRPLGQQLERPTLPPPHRGPVTRHQPTVPLHCQGGKGPCTCVASADVVHPDLPGTTVRASKHRRERQRRPGGQTVREMRGRGPSVNAVPAVQPPAEMAARPRRRWGGASCSIGGASCSLMSASGGCRFGTDCPIRRKLSRGLQSAPPCCTSAQ